MTPEQFVDLFQHALYLVLIMVAAIMIPGLIVGLVVSVFQAATSINEQTLSFLPRLLVTIITLMLLAHWLTRLLMDYFVELMQQIPSVMQ
ncbi:MAG: flagellar biosynthesis protein FliQ [Pseudomonadota bacterium]|uniref:Flagellar biosynthetic protein FliQ n=2 Tax=Gallaecimonas pentaromativorans TaxID=584787 RepID=A0A3N1P613_9GAMM|nr:flagellar biosynthesis protein FliQ [Gallaecimonas pentaromativorans]MED5526678.1 flagellar biosynthesis protein FliQ [Pseudomonadota bacterium]ROQ22577.1 flagellar biosynthetic protein FliQ [Gallaecimonas pentaromativorans]